MAEQDNSKAQPPTEPRGFGEHTRGLAGEYAHEQGWGLNEEERSKEDSAPQDTDGGTDYEYGARDFGDEPVNTSIPPDAKDPIQNQRGTGRKES
jgi:hypothetical protein